MSGLPSTGRSFLGRVPRASYYLAQKLALEPRDRFRSRSEREASNSRIDWAERRRRDAQAEFEEKRADALRAAAELARAWGEE